MSEEFDERKEQPEAEPADAGVTGAEASDAGQPDAEPIRDTWAEAQAGRNKKTYRWYLSVVGEVLLIIPLILALILLRRFFG
jgi:hypothetical protein